MGWEQRCSPPTAAAFPGSASGQMRAPAQPRRAEVGGQKSSFFPQCRPRARLVPAPPAPATHQMPTQPPLHPHQPKVLSTRRGQVLGHRLRRARRGSVCREMGEGQRAVTGQTDGRRASSNVWPQRVFALCTEHGGGGDRSRGCPQCPRARAGAEPHRREKPLETWIQLTCSG